MKLFSENEFTKIFKDEESKIDLVVSKAFDEDNPNVHFLVASIPTIPDLNVHGIQLPLQYTTPEERDKAFQEFDAEKLISLIKADIKHKQEELKKHM